MPRHKQLVCQHMEKISRSLLGRYQDLIRAYVKGRHGMYALYRGDRLYYVGLASNLRSRLKNHLRDRHGSSWDRFSVYLTIGADHLKEMETLFLRMGRPKGNRNLGRLARSENLHRRLRRDLKERHRHEEDELLGGTRRTRKDTRRKPLDREPRGARPVLAPLVSEPLRLRARYKRKTYLARIRRDGLIRYDGRLFRTPTAAGKAVLGRTCDGWTFWQVERAPGDWVKLGELRK